MASTPKVKAFLICDQVIVDKDGKHSVIGIFQQIHAPQLPVYHPRFGIYIRLGDMNGSYDLSIRFIEPKNERVLAEAQLHGIEHKRPLKDFESGVNLPGIEIPHEGTFEIHLIVNNQLIGLDTLQAIKVHIPPTPHDLEKDL